MRVLAVANAKGGTGKTTLAVHLAAGLARQGRRVLLVDLDPQANATQWLLATVAAGSAGAFEALTGDIDPGHIHEAPGRPGLWVLPASPALARAELALAGEVAGETLLRAALEELDGYDVAILDCPPSLGLTVLSALVAADGVVAPVPAAYLSLTGLGRLAETVERVRARLNARVRILGYVLFAADGREAITAETREVLRGEAGRRLYRAEVRVSTAAKSLPARHATAWEPSEDRRGAEDYPAVLAETMARLGQRTGRRGSHRRT